MTKPLRLSWKTAHRKNRTIEPKNNEVCQQLNPYKPSSSLRGSLNSIQDGNFERNPRRERRLSLSANSRGDSNKVVDNSFDDDACLEDDDLDNILSNIEGDSDEDKLPLAAAVPIDTENVATGVNSHLQQSSCKHKDAAANNTIQKHPILRVKPVNFENSDTTIYNTETSGVQNSEPMHQITVDMTAMDDSTSPFGFNHNSLKVDNPMNESPHKSPDTTIDPHPIRRKSIVDEIIDDGLFSQTDPIEDPASLHHNNMRKLEPIECIPQIVLSNNTNGSKNVHNNATNIFGEVNHHHQADDTISTVTDQTDTPFIFTYKRSTVDDDSVSQITSSLAPSLGSSVLKNISRRTKEGTAAATRFKNSNWMGSGVNRTKPIRHGAVTAGTFGRDRNRLLRGQMNSTCTISDAANSRYQERNSSLDEISYAINDSEMQMPPRSRFVKEFDLCTIDSEKSGVSRRRSNYDSNSYVSTLGNGGVSVAGQSTTNGSMSRGSSSKSGGLVAMLAKKAERFFLPASLKITQRKKFDRSDSSDSLEDLLLEEGAKTLMRMRPSSETNNDDIDYFSRAMSTSSYGSGNCSRGTLHGTRSASANIFRLCSVILLIVIVYMILLTEEGDNTERVEDVKPELGPVNNPNRSKRNADELQLDQYTDPNFSTDTKKVSSRHSKEYMHLPSALENLANVDAGPFQRSIDIPFYWHIPRSAGGTVSDILGSCLELVLASDAGSSLALSKEQQTLRVIHSPRQVAFVNIDTYTLKGIQRAKQLDLVASGMADVILSPLLHDASAALFAPTRKGRMFTMMRDPIERSASLFYFIQGTQWKRPETRNDELADMPIESFYEQGLAENNWMTRFLTNQLSKKQLTTQDAELAKEVLREKFLIGLVEKKVQSFERFQKYFGWIPSDNQCIQNKLEWSWPMKHKYVSVQKGTDAWGLISSQNTFDMMVYEYAKELFDHQESLVK